MSRKIYRGMTKNAYKDKYKDKYSDKYRDKEKDREMIAFIEQDLEAVVAYCKATCTEEVQSTLCMADEISSYNFLFQGKWELERTYVPVSFNEGNIAWDQMPFGDPEWVYAMNRHHCFVTLAKAYALTGDETYTKAFIHLLTHWIKHNPCTAEYEQTTWRTIEAGLRCENWIKAHELFCKSPHWSEDLEALFCRSLQEHAAYINRHHDDFRRLSNWGVIENHGLFVAGIYLGNTPYIETAKARLNKALQVQVHTDGLHWEQSQLYHNEVLRAFLDVAICAKNNHINLEENYHARVKEMVYAHLYMTKPNGEQLVNGDSDQMDARDLVVKAAYLYEEPCFKALGYKAVDFESIWDIGMRGKAVYDQLEGHMPEEISKALEASGHYCMRACWNEKSSYIHFKCGPLGGGHGHVDLLHVDVAYLGEDILKDQGRYTYTNTPERFALKEACAHNVVVVDDQPFTEILDTWGYGKVAQHVQRNFITHPLYDYVEGAHLGYMDLEDPVFANRKVIFIKPQIIVLIDEFIAKDTHTYKQYFHFGKGQLELEEHATFTAERAKATLYSLSEVQKEKRAMPSSDTYNHLENLETLITSKEGHGPTALTTFIILEDQKQSQVHHLMRVPIYTEGKVLEGDESIEAFKLSIGEDDYTLVVRHDEGHRRLIRVEGQDLFGKVCLIHECKGEIKNYTII